MKIDIENKLLPHDLSIEKIVLGNILTENASNFIGELSVDSFYDLRYQMIFQTMEKLVKEKKPVDTLTVVNQLKADGNLDIVGGAYEISKIGSEAGQFLNTEYYCKLLLQLQFRRNIINIGRSMQEKAYTEGNDIFDLMDNSVKEIREIEKGIVKTGFTSSSEIIENVVQQIDEAGEKQIIGYFTGMKNLDHVLMGLRKKKKYLIAARPGVGKTSLAKGICINLAMKQNVPGVFFSLEMPKEDLMMSCISEILQIPNDILQKGKISAHDRANIQHLKETIFTKNFIIIDESSLDPFEIRRILIRLIETHGVEWFAIDYIGLQRLKGKEYKSMTKEQRVSEIVSENKITCKELNLVGIELSQLNRDVERRGDYRPKLSDLRDSGEVEAAADVIIFPYRPDYHGIKELSPGISSEGFAEFIIAKNRFGPTKSIAGMYKGPFTQFVDHNEALELDIITNDNQPAF